MEEAVEQELSCSICFEVFNKPILLDCAHNFCFVHIEELAENVMDGVSVKCPICRAASRRNSILDFKVNLILANIIELMEHQTQQPQRSHSNSLTTPQQRSHSNSLTTPQQRSHSNSTNSSPPVLGITSLKVQVLEHKGPMQEMGWTYHQQDLNEKKQGKIYLCGLAS